MFIVYNIVIDMSNVESFNTESDKPDGVDMDESMC